jgi:hypothetical protein
MARLGAGGATNESNGALRFANAPYKFACLNGTSMS